MWTRVKALVWKEFLQLRRDRFTLAFVVGMPLMQLVIFGFAINYDVKHLPAVVLDESHSQESRSFVDGLEATQYFDVKHQVASESDLRKEIDTGRAKVGVWFPPDYARMLRSGQTAQVMVVVNASDPTTSGSAISTVTGVANLRSTQVLFDRMGLGPSSRPPVPIEVRVRPWYNPNMRSPTFIVPGLIGIMMAMTCVVYASASIVKERERGTLDQILVTPVSPLELFLGKAIPVVIMAYIQLSFLTLVGYLVFQVPVTGSLPLLYLCAVFFIVPMLGIGILISTKAQTQAQSNQMGMLTFMPMVFLSGYVFPIEGMPLFFQGISQVIPLTHFINIVRAIVLRGVGLEAFWPSIVKLLVLTLVIWTAALRSMRRASA
ncbi:MAG: ABC transporter permease [Acidobacteria bacterium]|nr:ABC transporter permease [Acidobacteriota bacterium]